MRRVEENKEVVKHFVKSGMEMSGGAYEEIVSWHLGVMSSFLVDISKSLAVIADSMSSQTGAEGSEE